MTTRAAFPYARFRDEFRRMWAAGASYREIQTAFGVTKGTVGSWRYRLGLPPRHLYCYDNCRDEFRRMWNAGASYEAIQQALGIAEWTIREWRCRLGLPARQWGGYTHGVRKVEVVDG